MSSADLLEAMQSHGCHTLVFSSSATLYGYPEYFPIPEKAPDVLQRMLNHRQHGRQ